MSHLSIENPVIYVPIRHPSTTVEKALQIGSFMQNKANFHKTEMSANLFTTKDYEKNADFRHGKTKPIQTQFKAKQSQFKPIIRPGKAKTNPIQTQFQNTKIVRIMTGNNSTDNPPAEGRYTHGSEYLFQKSYIIHTFGD